MKTISTSKVFVPLRAATWTIEDVRALRALVEQGASLEAIAKQLRRTVSSVRNKVSMQGLSLRTARENSAQAPELSCVRELRPAARST